MYIHHVLGQKAHANIITAQVGDDLSKVVSTLSEHNIGSVLVVDAQGKLSGLVSERDIVRLISRNGAGVLGEPVENHMTKSLKTAHKDSTVRDVLAEMTKGRFRHMPVLDGDELIGMVTIGDAVKAQLDELTAEKQALESMIMGS